MAGSSLSTPAVVGQGDRGRSGPLADPVQQESFSGTLGAAAAAPKPCHAQQMHLRFHHSIYRGEVPSEDTVRG